MSARGTMLLSGFGGACVALTLIAAVEWATMPEDGWVCGNPETGQVIDAVRTGRSYNWVDQWGVQHTIGPDDQADWLCAKINKDARQMTAPLPEELAP